MIPYTVSGLLKKQNYVYFKKKRCIYFSEPRTCLFNSIDYEVRLFLILKYFIYIIMNEWQALSAYSMENL